MAYRRKLLVTVLALAMVGAALLAGCSSKSDKTENELGTAKEGVLVVGLDDTFAPMGFRDEKGELVGFDIDLARAVGEEMGLKVEFKPINWDAKELELKSKNIDCIWNGMSQTPERMEKMALSKQYLNNKIVLMSLAEKGDVKITKNEDLQNYNIGTQAKSSALEVLEGNQDYDKFKDKIKEYGTYDDAILDLKAGRVDVIAIDQVLGEYKNNNMDGILAESEYNLGDDYYVIGFRKDDTKLRDDVNKAMEKLIKDGKAEEISKKWFGKNIAILNDNK